MTYLVDQLVRNDCILAWMNMMEADLTVPISLYRTQATTKELYLHINFTFYMVEQ